MKKESNQVRRKPDNLIYGVDDRPPLPETMLLGLQHVFLILISMVFPVLIVNILGPAIDPATGQSFISISMIAAGIITILQALRLKYIGSGYLCPSVCGPSFVTASILAVETGGISLLLGMTAFAGAVESVLSRFITRIRFLFPPEVMGVVVALVGITVIPLAIDRFFGIGVDDTETTGREGIVAIVTLATMIAISVWGKGKLRLYSVIVGMVIGYVAAFSMGIIPEASIDRIREAQWFNAPHIRSFHWSFDVTLLVPFIVATICSMIKSIGDLGTCQKINDADWKRPEMQTISRGILVDGLGGILPGLFGGFGISTSSSNVGLSVANGATSRVIAYAAGGIIIFLAFFPRLSELFLIMPAPVMGATLIFAVSFMIVAGLQMIAGRLLDVRRTFVLGLAIIFGLSADISPELYTSLPSWIQPVFSSSLSLGSISAIVVNLLMRIGISNRASLELHPGRHTSKDIFNFMEAQGGNWGARREVVTNAASMLNEVFETVGALDLAKSPLQVEVTFDELSFDIDISYKGTLIPLPEAPPSPEDIIKDKDAVGQLAGFIISSQVDRIRSSMKGDYCHIHLHFEH